MPPVFAFFWKGLADLPALLMLVVNLPAMALRCLAAMALRASLPTDFQPSPSMSMSRLARSGASEASDGATLAAAPCELPATSS